jgi:dinuclear metal center YbgI/SA1388 family protein
MKIAEIISHLETIAPPAYQESYDNTGLLTGTPESDCTGALITLDSTEKIVHEAIARNCNLIVAHHPILFGGLKKITGQSYVEKTIIAAIKNDIAIYAIHTNLDNVIAGVNAAMAERLGLVNLKVLMPKESTLKKMYTFVPHAYADKVREAIFRAGAGAIGNYNNVSFSAEGTGSFIPGEGAKPFVGDIGQPHFEKETKIETIFPAYLQKQVVEALIKAHPYEQVAYDIVRLANTSQYIGSGLLGELSEPLNESAFLKKIKEAFDLKVIKHTKLLGNPVKKVALCGGAGSFLISKALASGADFFISSDIKYHEFFDANSRLIVADIGHFESERFTIDLLHEILVKKFPTFAVLKTALNTNPVRYYL